MLEIDNGIHWRRNGERYIGSIDGACLYFMDPDEWGKPLFTLYRNTFPQEAPLARGRTAFLMRLAEIDSIR